MLLRVSFCVVITVSWSKISAVSLSSNYMFLDKKILHKVWLNPRLNLTIFRGTGPRTLAPDTTAIHSTRNSWQVMGSSLQLLINPEKAAKLLLEDKGAEKSSFQHFSAVFPFLTMLPLLFSWRYNEGKNAKCLVNKF